MLMTWMNHKNCRRWSEFQKFDQLMKNVAYHDGIKMFSDLKVGLFTSAFLKGVNENLQNEEELEKIVNEFGVASASAKTK